MGRRAAPARAGGGVRPPEPADRLAGALAADRAARDEHSPDAAGGEGSAGRLDVDEWGEVDAREVEEGAREGDVTLSATGWLPAAPDAAAGEQWNDGDGDVPVRRARRALGRTLVTAVPTEVRQGRWAVPWRAAVAALVLAAVVAVVLAVRTADAVPVEQVPDRPTSAGAGAGAGASGGGPSGAGSSVTGSSGGAPSPATAGQSGAAPLAVVSQAPAPGTAPAAGAASAPGALVVVHVVGQVVAPGLVRVAPGSRVADALDAAGGATADADLSRVNLARVVVDGEQVVVPRPGEALAGAVPGSEAAAAGSPGDPAASGPGAPVNLNTADAVALDGLPGIGQVLAGRILAWRQERGPFTSVEELREVAGIGDALMADLTPLVTV